MIEEFDTKMPKTSTVDLDRMTLRMPADLYADLHLVVAKRRREGRRVSVNALVCELLLDAVREELAPSTQQPQPQAKAVA